MRNKNTAVKDTISLLETCFREESPHMVKFAARLLDNKGLAEVVVQDCFVFALEHIDVFQGSPNPVGWLYKTLKNFIGHAIRDQQTYLKHIVQSEDALELYTPQFDQYSQGLLDDANNPDLRLLVQFYICGYSIAELADHYHSNPGAIKMRIRRAKERLKNQL